MSSNEAFDRAVDVIGDHDACGTPTTGYQCASPPLAHAISAAQGKPLWESELGGLPATVTNPTVPGPGSLTHTLDNAYSQAGVTGILLWPLIDAVPPWLPYENRGLVYADDPWDGYYQVNPLTWVTAQTTQFTAPGWRYVKGASGQLSCACDASFVTYESPARDAWSMVVQTSVATAPQQVSVNLTGGLPGGAVHVWSTSLSARDYFVRHRDVSAQHHVFSYKLLPGYVYTFTSTKGQAKGTAVVPVSRPAPMPLPYAAAPDRGRHGRHAGPNRGLVRVRRRGAHADCRRFARGVAAHRGSCDSVRRRRLGWLDGLHGLHRVELPMAGAGGPTGRDGRRRLRGLPDAGRRVPVRRLRADHRQRRDMAAGAQRTAGRSS